MEFMDMVARTDEGRAYYRHLADNAARDADAWQKAMPHGKDGTDSAPAMSAGAALARYAREPLRLSIEGVPLADAPSDLLILYRLAYENWEQVNAIAKEMEHLWYAPDSDAPSSADAIRFLTWQLRDANDELEWLERMLGKEKARRIREEVVPPRPHHARGKRQPAPTPRFSQSLLRNPESVYEEIGLLQSRTVSQVRDTMKSSLADDMTLTEALVREYAAEPMQGEFTGIDLETSGLSPRIAYIVDAGWERYDMSTGRAFDAQRHSYGLSKERAALGMPSHLVNLNGIDVPMLESFTPFQEDTAAQKAMMDALNGTIMVAHNASFERRFLTGNCAGFAEAVREGRIRILDSRLVAIHVDDYRFRGFSLDDYARRHGAIAASQGISIPAADGGMIPLDLGEHERHLGLEDTHIMMVAMRCNLDELHERFLKGEPVMVDDETREGD